MVWWKIVLIICGIILASGGAFIALIYAYAAIQDYRMSKKYPDWKSRGGWKP